MPSRNRKINVIGGLCVRSLAWAAIVSGAHEPCPREFSRSGKVGVSAAVFCSSCIFRVGGRARVACWVYDAWVVFFFKELGFLPGLGLAGWSLFLSRGFLVESFGKLALGFGTLWDLPVGN